MKNNNVKIHQEKVQVIRCTLNISDMKARCQMSTSMVRQLTIKKEDNLHYLGVVFDLKLNHCAQISRIITKSRRGLNALNVMTRDRMSQRNLPLLFDMLVISQVDYSFGMLTLSNIQLCRHEGMRTIQRCIRNTPLALMWYVLGLRAIKESHKLAQFKDYLRVCRDP